MPAEKIKVLIVEDSNAVRALLAHILNSDPHVTVIGTAQNGREALQFLTETLPDVILMDIEMPVMDGFETTRRIMETQPVPIIICSGSSNPRETITTFRLMEAGAVACVEKPRGVQNEKFDAMRDQLLETVKLMSEVKVIRRWPRLRAGAAPAGSSTSLQVAQKNEIIDLIGIGASTGGPPVLGMILTALPKNFRVPILIVQHIAPGFLQGLVEWLGQTTGMNVRIGVHGEQLLAGHVYLAPDDFHMTVRAGQQIVLGREEPDDTLRPSVAHLFNSLAQECGPRAVGVLLTGMGTDGAKELKIMKDRGAVTIVQDRETSIVHGMPGAAIALDAANYVLPASQIGPALVALVNRQPVRPGGLS